MTGLYDLVLVVIVILSVICSFKMGYSYGARQAGNNEPKPVNKSSLIENIRDVITDVVYPVLKKKENDEDYAEKVETADGRRKAARKFFS